MGSIQVEANVFSCVPRTFIVKNGVLKILFPDLVSVSLFERDFIRAEFVPA